MATETMILRPISSNYEAGAIPKYVPSDTTEENAYMLVNEAVADDDATYITLSGTIVTFELGIAVETQKHITSSKIHIRARAAGAGKAFTFYIRATSKVDDNNDAFDNTIVTSESDDWCDYTYDLQETVAAINGAEHSNFRVNLTGGEGENAKGGGLNQAANADFTQVYLELTYEESDPIYIRENNTWTPIEGTIYRKENGAWVQSDTDVFVEGEKFTLVTV